jgi:hypothetical protein
VHIFPFSVFSMPGPEQRMEGEFDQCVQVLGRFQENITPAAAVPAIRATPGDVFFPPET